MFVMCCMSVSAVLDCVHVISREGIYMVAIVTSLVLLRCTPTVLSSVLCVLMVEGMSVVVNVMLSLA